MGGRGCGTPSKQTARRHGGRARRPSACILVASLARLPPARDGEPTMLMQYLPYDTHSTPAAQPASRAAGASAGGDQKVQSVWCLSLSPSLTASSLSLRLCRPCLSLAVCWCLLSCTAAPPTQTHRLPMNEEIKFIVAHLFAVCTNNLVFPEQIVVMAILVVTSCAGCPAFGNRRRDFSSFRGVAASHRHVVLETFPTSTPWVTSRQPARLTTTSLGT